MFLDRELLQQLWGAPLQLPAAAGFTAVSTDSRQLPPGCLFVPLVGERLDGHAFLDSAVAAGCAAVLVQAERLTLEALGALQARVTASACGLWLVPDTLLAYQQLAGLWRRQLALPLVAVTGSAGKTSTRELIRAALAPLGPVQASSGNENNDIGVPLTLLKAGPQHSALVVEMGMRGLGEIERLSRCAQPDVAVITNIGTAHIGRLGSREAIAQAKCEIVSALAPDGVVVIPAGDPLLDQALAAVWSGRVRRVALRGDPQPPQLPPPDLIADYLEAADTLMLLPSGAMLRLPLPGRHQARNLLLAVAVAQELKVPVEALEQLQVDLPGGRSRQLQLGAITVLDETYNASPEAMEASLALLISQPGRHFAVLGQMLELGEQSLGLHRQIATIAATSPLEGLILVGDGEEITAMLDAAASLERLVRVSKPEQAIEPLQEWLLPGDTVLVKASRGVALERLLPLMIARYG
jgi:UDP-N-acetylmuramoyl-tripeptide--D-alanyl-D-alanine ligase